VAYLLGMFCADHSGASIVATAYVRRPYYPRHSPVKQITIYRFNECHPEYLQALASKLLQCARPLQDLSTCSCMFVCYAIDYTLSMYRNSSNNMDMQIFWNSRVVKASTGVSRTQFHLDVLRCSNITQSLQAANFEISLHIC
jgi:hypothetical protein